MSEIVLMICFFTSTVYEDGNYLPFHASMAENIEVLSGNIAKLKVENPASVVCTNRKLYPGEGVMLKIEPTKDGGRIPGSFNFTLGVSTLTPSVLSNNDPESFSVCKRIKKPKRWRRIRKFEEMKTLKDESNACTGYLQIMLHENGELKYSHSSLIHGHVTIPTNHYADGVLVVLDLFRVNIEVVKTIKSKSYDYYSETSTSHKTQDTLSGKTRPANGNTRHTIANAHKLQRQDATDKTRENNYIHFVPRIKGLLTKVPSSSF